MQLINWLSGNWIEVFGAAAGIIYVFLEIRQNLWLWPVGIVTSAIYIWVFFTGRLYADMSLQGYYLVISGLGWYWWVRGQRRSTHGAGLSAQDSGAKGRIEALKVTRIKFKLAVVLSVVFIALFSVTYFVLDRFTDSPVPVADSFITSLSIIATWMLARKIYDHWYLWIVVNSVASILFLTRELYATVILYIIYCIMSFVGLRAWKISMNQVCEK